LTRRVRHCAYRITGLLRSQFELPALEFGLGLGVGFEHGAPALTLVAFFSRCAGAIRSMYHEIYAGFRVRIAA
jgi:hypothetical protein